MAKKKAESNSNQSTGIEREPPQVKRTANWFYKNFRKHFPELHPADYMDTLIIQLRREATIDVIALDEYLTKKHEPKEGESMADVVLKYYGQEAYDFVLSAI